MVAKSSQGFIPLTEWARLRKARRTYVRDRVGRFAEVPGGGASLGATATVDTSHLGDQPRPPHISGKYLPPHEQLVDNFGDYWDAATPSERSEGREWYEQRQAEVEKLAADSGHTPEQVAGVMAAISPALDWDKNAVLPELIVKWHDEGRPIEEWRYPDGKGVAVMPANRKKAYGALDGTYDPTKGGPKVGAFYRAIMGDDDAVTIDTWMVRAGFDNLGIPFRDAAPTAKAQRELAGALADAAREDGVSPRDYQAATWLAARRVSKDQKAARSGASLAKVSEAPRTPEDDERDVLAAIEAGYDDWPPPSIFARGEPVPDGLRKERRTYVRDNRGRFAEVPGGSLPEARPGPSLATSDSGFGLEGGRLRGSSTWETTNPDDLDLLTDKQREDLGGLYRLENPDVLKGATQRVAADRLATADDEIARMFPDNPSRWNGRVRWASPTEGQQHYAAFNPDTGTVDVDPALLEERDVMLSSVLVHEMFHAHSAGDTRAYQYNRGYEEGLAESLTDIHRQDIVAQMNRPKMAGGFADPIRTYDPEERKVGPERAASIERGKDYYQDQNAYKGYVNALEGLRSYTGEEKQPFYDWLERVPLEYRSDAVHAKVMDWIGANTGRDSAEEKAGMDMALRADRYLKTGNPDAGFEGVQKAHVRAVVAQMLAATTPDEIEAAREAARAHLRANPTDARWIKSAGGQLTRMARLTGAERVEKAKWNPALHPRNPKNGHFINVPGKPVTVDMGAVYSLPGVGKVNAHFGAKNQTLVVALPKDAPKDVSSKDLKTMKDFFGAEKVIYDGDDVTEMIDPTAPEAPDEPAVAPGGTFEGDLAGVGHIKGAYIQTIDTLAISGPDDTKKPSEGQVLGLQAQYGGETVVFNGQDVTPGQGGEASEAGPPKWGTSVGTTEDGTPVYPLPPVQGEAHFAIAADEPLQPVFYDSEAASQPGPAIKALLGENVPTEGMTYGFWSDNENRVVAQGPQTEGPGPLELSQIKQAFPNAERITWFGDNGKQGAKDIQLEPSEAGGAGEADPLADLDITETSAATLNIEGAPWSMAAQQAVQAKYPSAIQAVWNGKVQMFPTEAPKPPAAPATDDDPNYVAPGSNYQAFKAFNANTGAADPVWSVPLPSQMLHHQGPAKQMGVVYGSDNHGGFKGAFYDAGDPEKPAYFGEDLLGEGKIAGFWPDSDVAAHASGVYYPEGVGGGVMVMQGKYPTPGPELAARIHFEFPDLAGFTYNGTDYPLDDITGPPQAPEPTKLFDDGYGTDFYDAPLPDTPTVFSLGIPAEGPEVEHVKVFADVDKMDEGGITGAATNHYDSAFMQEVHGNYDPETKSVQVYDMDSTDATQEQIDQIKAAMPEATTAEFGYDGVAIDLTGPSGGASLVTTADNGGAIVDAPIPNTNNAFVVGSHIDGTKAAYFGDLGEVGPGDIEETIQAEKGAFQENYIGQWVPETKTINVFNAASNTASPGLEAQAKAAFPEATSILYMEDNQSVSVGGEPDASPTGWADAGHVLWVDEDGQKFYNQPLSGKPSVFVLGSTKAEGYEVAQFAAADPDHMDQVSNESYAQDHYGELADENKIVGYYDPASKKVAIDSPKEIALPGEKLENLLDYFPQAETLYWAKDGKTEHMAPKVPTYAGASEKKGTPAAPAPTPTVAPGEYDPDAFAGHFDNLNDAENWANGTYSSWAAAVPSSQRSALRGYKDGMFSDMNGALREHGSLGAIPTDNTFDLDNVHNIKRIDKALKTTPAFTEPVTLYRGRLPNSLMDAADAYGPEALVGETFSDPAFMSTTIKRGTAKSFGEGSSRPSVGRFTAPKGFHAAYMESIDSYNEAEFLVPRDAKFKVTEAHYEGSTLWVDGDFV